MGPDHSVSGSRKINHDGPPSCLRSTATDRAPFATVPGVVIRNHERTAMFPSDRVAASPAHVGKAKAVAQDFYGNPNMFYMAVMMVAPMAILMLALMGAMYPKRRWKSRALCRIRHSLYRGLRICESTDLHRQRAVPAFDDTASFGRDPDVRRGCGERSGHRRPVRQDYPVAAPGDR
jgi:hypothetical protein